jgi:hypothetical protein
MKKLVSNVTILKLMPGEVHRTDTNVTYTITHPDWVCEWIIPNDPTGPVKRSCILNHGLDPLDPSNNYYVIKLIPGLFTEVQSVINGWIQGGDVNAMLLLKHENKPAFILYAENTIGLKIIT